MNKCVNCTYTTENDEKFCPNCGSEMVTEAVAEAVPAAKPGSKAMPITGMIFSIVGLHNSLTLVLVNLLLLLAGGSFILPLLPALSSTTGLILSIISTKRGNKSTFTRLGMTFSIIGLIVDVVHTIVLVLLTILVGTLVTTFIFTQVIAPR